MLLRYFQKQKQANKWQCPIVAAMKKYTWLRPCALDDSSFQIEILSE